MERYAPSKRNAAVHEAACEWFVEFRTGEPSEAARKAFLGWLQESPAHMAAYLEVTTLWNDAAAVNRDQRWTVDELIRQAARDPDNVISIEGASSTAGVARTQPGPGHRLRLGVLLPTAASILIFLLTGLTYWYIQRGTYSTGIGELRSLTLADGSTIQLNARSKLRVRFSEHQRQIELIRGQALFLVAKHPDRPFIVVSNDTRVRAVGTQFDVNQKTRGTIVTVIEGKVAVFDSRAGSLPTSIPAPPSGTPADNTSVQADRTREPIYLSAGEQLALTGAVQPAAKPINPAAVTAWTQRQLVFDSASLAEVAEEFNRYNEKQLVVRDRALQDFQIDGVFTSTDPASLVRFLRARADVQVTETSSTIFLDRRARVPSGV